MLEKLWHKKWMVLCLVLGSLLLTATAVSFPMYKNAAFNRMIKDEFHNALLDTNIWPAANKNTIISKKDAHGKSISRMEQFISDIYNQLDVTEKQTLVYYSLAKEEAYSAMKRQDVGELNIRLGLMSNLMDHVHMLSGEMYSEEGVTQDGIYEVVISQAAMVNFNILVGETIEFENLKDYNGNPIQVKITGVFTSDSQEDYYWQVSPDELTNVCLMNEELFRILFTGEHAGKYTITCNYFTLFEYKDMEDGKVSHLIDTTKYLTKESVYRSTMSEPAYLDILESFQSKRARIQATLFILQVPVLILLCAFLFMISGQMYDMERNEISVIKSRGGSGNQIFRLYLYQSIFLTMIGAALGIPLGNLFCRILGSTENFLEFDMKRTLFISYTWEVWLYALVTVCLSIMIMTLPALKHSKLTIVKLKQQKTMKKKSWWEKIFLDVICVGVSLYGYYTYTHNTETLTYNVLKGESLDPLLYISSSLFIIGTGLVFLRMQPLFIRGIYEIGKKWWKPANYVSFMETIKNGRKQQFIMLFMILTISLGMFHATVARTILQNAKDNMVYLDGADIIIKEVWEDNHSFLSQDKMIEFQYYEPDYSKYATLNGVDSYTKVLMDTKAYLSLNSNKRQEVTVMGIQTKEFGENTKMLNSVLDMPYYQYLNDLAVEADGILVSSNIKKAEEYKIGDSLAFYNEKGNKGTGRIVGFIDYWPGYEPVTTQLSEDGSVSTIDNYLIIGHLTTLQQYFGITPYQVWMSVKEGQDTDFFYQWIQDNDVRVSMYTDRLKDIKEVAEDPLLQGTNGVLTMSFIVTILLCGVGYLIYFIMSIRAREMVFGVLRACGMHKSEIFLILINEQLFSGVISVLAGIGIGKLTSVMFVPMLQSAYAAANQVLPMRLITYPIDMIRLYSVIAGVMIICLIILIILTLKLNVAKALKLGEE